MAQIRKLAFDLISSIPIFRSVAVAEAVSQSLTYKFQQSHRNLVFNWSGEMGFWEADQVNWKEWRPHIRQRTHDIVMRVVEVAFESPSQLLRHLSHLVKIRDSYLDNYYTTVRSFNKINSTQLADFNYRITALKTARFFSSVGLVVGAAAATLASMSVASAASLAPAVAPGTSALTAPGIALVKSMSFSLIKTWNAAPTAEVTAVAIDTARAGGSEGGVALGGLVAKEATKTGALFGGTLHIPSANEDLALLEAAKAKLNRMCRTRIGGQSARGVVQRQAQIEAQKRTVQNLTQKTVQVTTEREAKKWAIKGLGNVLQRGSLAVFVTWDMYDAFNDLYE